MPELRGVATSAPYDWCRDGSSTVADHLPITFRLLLTTMAILRPSFGNGINEIYNRDLGDRAACTPGSGELAAGHEALSANTRIIGISLGIGSGWSGTFEGAVDNISIASSTPGAAGLADTNFEVVPEPAAAILGLMEAVPLLVRKRRTA